MPRASMTRHGTVGAPRSTKRGVPIVTPLILWRRQQPLMGIQTQRFQRFGSDESAGGAFLHCVNSSHTSSTVEFAASEQRRNDAGDTQIQANNRAALDSAMTLLLHSEHHWSRASERGR